MIFTKTQINKQPNPVQTWKALTKSTLAESTKLAAFAASLFTKDFSVLANSINSLTPDIEADLVSAVQSKITELYGITIPNLTNADTQHTTHNVISKLVPVNQLAALVLQQLPNTELTDKQLELIKLLTIKPAYAKAIASDPIANMDKFLAHTLSIEYLTSEDNFRKLFITDDTSTSTIASTDDLPQLLHSHIKEANSYPVTIPTYKLA